MVRSLPRSESMYLMASRITSSWVTFSFLERLGNSPFSLQQKADVNVFTDKIECYNATTETPEVQKLV